MQTLLTNMNKNEGYVSIETIIIAGLIIALGAFLISKFAGEGKDLSKKALNRVSDVQREFDTMTNFDDFDAEAACEWNR